MFLSISAAAAGPGEILFNKLVEWLEDLVLFKAISIGDSGGVEIPQSDDRQDTDTSDCNLSGRLLISVGCKHPFWYCGRWNGIVKYAVVPAPRLEERPIVPPIRSTS